MNLDLLSIAICNGCFWSGLMDAAFPFYFDRLPKPFGCSKCMAFWSMTIYVLFYTFATVTIPIELLNLTIPFVSALVAAIGYRTFRLR